MAKKRANIYIQKMFRVLWLTRIYKALIYAGYRGPQ